MPAWCPSHPKPIQATSHQCSCPSNAGAAFPVRLAQPFPPTLAASMETPSPMEHPLASSVWHQHDFHESLVFHPHVISVMLKEPTTASTQPKDWQQQKFRDLRQDKWTINTKRLLPLPATRTAQQQAPLLWGGAPRTSHTNTHTWFLDSVFSLWLLPDYTAAPQLARGNFVCIRELAMTSKQICDV